MSEMIERGIRAGIKTRTDFSTWDAQPQRELVVAIIEAMREPTQEMLEAIDETVVIDYARRSAASGVG